jgi:hypothetical protein
VARVRCLIKLPVRHIEKAVHHEGRVCALKIIWSLSRCHVHILDLVDENGWHFMNIPIPCRRCNHRLIQIQLKHFMFVSLCKSALKLLFVGFQVVLRVDVMKTHFAWLLRVSPKIAELSVAIGLLSESAAIPFFIL